jgi:hypothetical protein
MLFNDMLGSTLGSREGNRYDSVKMTSFGDGDKKAFYTGKPNVPELGYPFLLRNYRSDLGKWQTADHLANGVGISMRLRRPDGLNNFAYVNNGVTSKIDWLVGWSLSKWLYTGDGNASDAVYNASVQAGGSSYYDGLYSAMRGYADIGSALNYYGQTSSLVEWDETTAFTQEVIADPLVKTFTSSFKINLQSKIEKIIKATGTEKETSPLLTLDTGATFDLGSALILGRFYVEANAHWTVSHVSGNKYRYNGTIDYSIDDTFDFDLKVKTLSMGLLSLGKPFKINVTWSDVLNGVFYE